MDVVQVSNPAALDSALLGDFLARVFPPDSLALPGGFERRRELVKKLLGDPAWRLWVGVEQGRMVGCLMAFCPDEVELLLPQVLHFHNDGSPSLRRAMIAEWLAFCRSKGHVKAWAINGSDRPDSLWARAMRAAGEWRRVGSIMEVTLR